MKCPAQEQYIINIGIDDHDSRAQSNSLVKLNCIIANSPQYKRTLRGTFEYWTQFPDGNVPLAHELTQPNFHEENRDRSQDHEQ